MNAGYIFKQLKTTLLFMVISTILFGGMYPGLITAILQSGFSHKSNGSLVIFQSQAIGSELIGQAFTNPKYFWGRPSATSPLPYDPAVSSGSNFSPANPKLLSLINQRVEELRKYNPSNTMRIPVDLITSSASGLDPHISISSARYQIQRVAKARNILPEKVNHLIERQIIERKIGFIGEPCVNVLMLNLALDREFETQSDIPH
jgi:potassium-transporting ATPase KdpC subunit